MLLSIGTQALAAKGAIVKRLKSVETLGSTSAICSDKTGTLTLNQMTARQLVLAGRRYSVDGEGYSTTGRILRVGGTGGSRRRSVARSTSCSRWRLANDAVIRDGECIGDPTEGALVVLAAKSGLDVEETRHEKPRVGEVPFDAEYKLMATFHEIEGVVRCFVKGAPDVLLARSTTYLDVDGATRPIEDRGQRALTENDRIASEGMRVLAVARRDFDPKTFDPNGDLLALVNELEFLALIGIVDPPRKEAKDAIALCKDAGIRVRMITGDHATTAAAIAAELGIEGRALTGAEFAAMPDDELSAAARHDRCRRARRARRQGAAREPAQGAGEHRRDDRRRRERRSRAHTRRHRRRDGDHRHGGDEGRGGDDPHRRQLRHDRGGGRGRAWSLRQPDEVHPGPDDHAGRLHPHVPRCLDLQHRGGSPLLPLQILWVNFAVDVVLAFGLGFDAPTPGLMKRKPRSPDDPVIGRALGVRLGITGLLISIGVLIVVSWGETRYGLAVATTMGFVTTALMHIVASLEWRDPERTIFTGSTIANGRFNLMVLLALVFTFMATTLNGLERILETVDLSGAQWRACWLAVLAYLVFAELEKLILPRITHNER